MLRTKWVFSLVMAGFLTAAAFPARAVTQIRFATVVPEGTSWLNEMRKLAQDIKEKTNGEVELKIYDSSKMGDELDVLRKMRSGQIHAGAFSGFGLGAVDSAIRVMELPFLFHSNEEVDFVYKKMYPVFSKRYEAKDMILLGTGEAGAVNIYSKNPIRSQKDLSEQKMWVWEGDPLALAFFKAAEVSPVPLPITEVITGLQTGMINGVYTPPIGAIGFQWWTKVSYMTTPNLNNATGGMLMTKKAWQTLSPKNQTIVKEAAQRAGERITSITRIDNEQAIVKLKQNNIKFAEVDAASMEQFKKISEDVRKKLIGKLYDANVLKQVEDALAEYRAGAATKPAKPTNQAKR